MVCSLALVVAAGVTQAVELPPYRPHDHPARLERRIGGYTRPWRSLHLAAEVAARAVDVRVDVGERISNAEEAVIVLDDAMARLALSTAEAALAQAHSQVAQAAAQVQLREREAAFQQQEEQRIAALVAEGRVSGRDHDAARFAHEAAVLQVKAAQAVHAVAEAGVVVAQAEVARLQDQVARHRLTAPAGWTVVARHLHPGSLVAPGTPLLELVDLGRLDVVLHLDAAELAALRAHDEPMLGIGREAVAVPVRLAFVDPRFDPGTRRHRVELALTATALAERGLEVLGGQRAELVLTVASPEAGLLIPQGYVFTRHERRLVRDAAGREWPLTLLRSDARHLLVSAAGLPEDLTVVAPDRER